MSELDGRLHTAARAIPFVLPEKYIANALQGKGVEPSEHLKNLLNHQYAKKIGVEHLYVLNKRGKDVVYLAGSEAIVST
nr:hypothetical protein [uncultured Deefgea sp.]